MTEQGNRESAAASTSRPLTDSEARGIVGGAGGHIGDDDSDPPLTPTPRPVPVGDYHPGDPDSGNSPPPDK